MFFAKVSNVVYPCNVFHTPEFLSKIINRIIRIGVLIYVAIPYANGQPTYQEFLSEKDIFKKSEIALFLGNEYLRNDLDSLKIVSVELLLDAAEKKNKFARAVGYFSLGSYQIRSGKIETGIHHLKQSKRHFELINDYTQLSVITNEIGNAHVMMGTYQTAIGFYLKSLHYGKNAKDETEAFNAKLGLGRAYYSIGDTALGIMTIQQYKNRAIEHRKFEAAANAYAFLGQIEMDRKNYDLSREYYKKNLEMCAKASSKIQLSHSFNNKAILHFNLGELDSSLYYFNKAMELRILLNNKKGVAESFFNIANYYSETGDTTNALHYFKESASIALSNYLLADEKDALEEILLIYKNLSNEKGCKRVQLRLDELHSIIQSKSAADSEIIDYTEKIVGNTKMLNSIEAPRKSKSYLDFFWFLIVGVPLSLAYLFLKKAVEKRKY